MGIKKKIGKLAVVTCLVGIAGGQACAKTIEITDSNVTVTGDNNNHSAESGGYYTNAAEGTTFEDATFKNNKATGTAKRSVDSGQGGAILSPTGPTITKIENTDFRGNEAWSEGGAVASFCIIKDGIIDTVFEQNKVTYTWKKGDDESLKEKAGQGGGLYLGEGSDIQGAGIKNVTFNKNTATRYGGALMNWGTVNKIRL